MKGKYGNKRSLDVLVYIMQADLMEWQEVLPRRRNFSANAFPGKNLSSKNVEWNLKGMHSITDSWVAYELFFCPLFLK